MSLLLALPAALAYDSIGATWADDTVTVHLSDELGSLDEAAVEEALQAAIAAYNDVACSGLTLVYGGRASGTFGAVDGQNLVFVMTDSWPEDPGLLSTPSIYVDGGEIVEVDIALNAQGYAWAANGANGTSVFDLQAGFTHELGHLLGLWHSSVEGASLNPAMAGNPEARSLEEDDIAGLCALYPAVADGEGAFGEACAENADCAAGLFCLADGEARYCSQDCEDDAACPRDYVCLDLAEGGACAVEAKSGGCGCASTRPAAAGLLGLLGFVALRSRGGPRRGRQSCR